MAKNVEYFSSACCLCFSSFENCVEFISLFIDWMIFAVLYVIYTLPGVCWESSLRCSNAALASSAHCLCCASLCQFLGLFPVLLESLFAKFLAVCLS